MKSLMFSLLICLSCSFAQAQLLNLSQDSQNMKGVTLSNTAVANDMNLTNVGSGLRKKYVAIFGTSVYVIQFFALDVQAVDKTSDNFLPSMVSQNATAVRLDFVYNVSAEQVYTAFVDALSENNVDLEESSTAEFLSYVKEGGDAPNGSSMTFLLTKQEGGLDRVDYEDPNGEIKSVKGENLAQEILSMWLGEISANDKGLKELKAELLK